MRSMSGFVSLGLAALFVGCGPSLEEAQGEADAVSGELTAFYTAQIALLESGTFDAEAFETQRDALDQRWVDAVAALVKAAGSPNPETPPASQAVLDELKQAKGRFMSLHSAWKEQAGASG